MATRRKSKTKAEKEQDDLVASLTGKLKGVATELGEHVVVRNHASLSQEGSSLIRGLRARLGGIAELLEFFVLFDDNNGAALTIRVRAVADSRPTYGRSSLLRHRETIEALEVGAFKRRLLAEFNQVEELMTLRRQVRKLEERLDAERENHRPHPGRPYGFELHPYYGRGGFISADGPFGRG